MSDTSTPTTTPSSNSTGSILSKPVGSLSGEGMDRRVKKKRWTPRRLGLIAAGVAVVALIVWALLGRGGGQRLNVEQDRLTIATVEEGAFQEYVAVTGTVLPARTIYLDAVVGGQVEEKFVEEGAVVQAGQAILRLSNDNLTLQMLSSEAQLAEQLNNIRATRLALDQNALNLAQQMTELDYNITRLRREHDRTEDLADRGSIARQEYEAIRDEYAYMQRRRDLTRQSHRQDSLARVEELRQMEGQVSRLRRNLSLVQSTLDNLVVRAPIDGQLSLLDAEVGESKSAGTRLGQIDAAGSNKVRAAIDEFYITRVTQGQAARAELDGQSYDLVVRKVFPEVRDGRFEVEFAFDGAEPPNLRRGQSLRLRLELGDPEDALLIPRGAFFQTTGGNWVYVLEGDEAVRRTIRLGRQNPQNFEVLEGLAIGEQVVVSGYDTFGDADRLVLR
ncbi:MAG: efflux RND transporter periplasmic adaptor subunit [Rhodothermaceae bacterium]|nr:efflux RND transporter periplasmic adaptor subunit [Rhodothermaceae bacterium]